MSNWTVSGSGTTGSTPALTINSETNLIASDTTNASYQAFVDIDAMQPYDQILLKIYTAVLNGGTLHVCWEGAFNGPLVSHGGILVKIAPPIASDQNFKFTIQQVQAGYTVSAIVGTVPDGTSVTGVTSGATGTVRVPGGGNVSTSGTTIIQNTNTIAFQSGEVVQKDGSNTFTLSSAGAAVALPWKVLRQ